MDFGIILDQWERGKSNVSPKRTGVMDTWLYDNAVFDKDSAIIQKNNIPGETRRRLLHGKPDDILDIHGLTKDKAWLSLDLFFTRARSCGFEKLRIIHGKGNHSTEEATLGRTVRAFIEQCPYAGESGYEKSAGGGSGATWVLLKE
jgi:DNA-nicking Smr family endonuclease